MSLRSTIFGAACALALAGFVASPALADGTTDFDGLLGADYSHVSLNHGGPTANAYGVTGTGMFGVGSDFAVQADGGYHNVQVNHGGGSTNDWTVDGSAFWRSGMGRIGAVVGYDSADGSGTDAHVTNYGAFGEWYASRWFTLGLKGGGFTGSASTKGDYAGVAATAYAMPDLSFTAGYDYAHIQHFSNENDWSAKAEWLVSERTPVALYATYTNSKLSGTGGITANTFMIGLTYFCDSTGPAPLVARQREGAEEWGTTFGPTGLKF